MQAGVAGADPYMIRPLITLDLDGTLLETTDKGTHDCGQPGFTFSNLGQKYETRFRPGLAIFLQALLDADLNIAIWTAGSLSYATLMLAGIEKLVPGLRRALKATFSRDQVQWQLNSFGEHSVLKDLRLLSTHLNYPLSRVLIVDDTPDTYRLNPNNAVPVPPWRGDPDDCALDEVCTFLCSMPTRGEPLDVRNYRLATPTANALCAEAVDGSSSFVFNYAQGDLGDEDDRVHYR